MELLLTIHTRRSNVQVQVTCDDQLSHTFYLYPAMVLDTPAEVLLPPSDPVVYGKVLYQALFPPGSRAKRILEKQPERIVLVATDHKLDAIPWEYTYGPYSQEATENFLVLECHFVRGLPSEQRIAPPTLDRNLHIIAVPSHPLSHDLNPLNIDAEWLRLKEIIEKVQYACTLQRTRPPTLEELRQQLANQRFRIVHFMGHGSQSEDEAVLCFEKADGDLDRVSARQFVMRIRGTVFLVSLNACTSATPGSTSFHNLAAALVRQKVPYALGMRFSIDDNDARDFSRIFYGNLVHGTSVEEALLQARLTLAQSTHSWVVGVPVLYTALANPAIGFTSPASKPIILDSQPPIEHSALPRTEGSFRGRIKELKWLGNALTADRRARVVTIYGGGGQGKTALAREAIERFAHAWPGGVYAVSLETLLSLPTFVTSLAHFLHIDTTDTLDIQEIARRVAAHLAQHRTLIVLDNAETLVEAVERNEAAAIQLGQFLQQLPSSTVSLLVTSRRQLGWAGEQSIELQGLSPAEGTALFTEHAPQRVQEIDRATTWSLSEQVEGHPLSLRLLGSAFNNASHLTLPAFIATYEDELVKAENKYRDLDHRQRTLYACIDTSVRYLSTDLRGLLSCLWVFHASFLPESAARIFEAGYPHLDESTSPVYDHLHTLWQRSLLVREIVQAGDTSTLFYRLLPTTRIYLERYLEQAYERSVLQTRFGQEYYRLVQFVYEQLDTGALAPLLAERAREDIERGGAYVDGITQGYYLNRWGWVQQRLGYLHHGLKLFEEALEIAEGGDKSLEASSRSYIAQVYQRIGQVQQALNFGLQALSLFKEVRDPQREAVALANIAEVYHHRGQLHDALRFYEQALPLLRKVHDRKGEAVVLNNIASIYANLGQPHEALKCYQQALPIRHEVDDRQGEAVTLSGMATVYHDIGESGEALRLYQQALPLLREVGDGVGEIATLINMARVHHDTGELGEALRLYQQALPVCQEYGDRPGEAQALNNMATLYRALDQPGEALRLYERALPIHREISNPQGEAGTLVNMAAVYHIFNRLNEALHLYQQALAIHRKIGDRQGEATALSNMATLYHDLRQPQEELRCNQQALSIRREIDDRAGQVASLINMAYLSRDMKRYQEALRTFAEATELAHQIAQPASECAALVGSAMILYQDLNRKQEGIASMVQAIAILERWELPQDASRQTLADLRRVLKQMQTGNPLGQASHEERETKDSHLSRGRNKREKEKAMVEEGDLNLIRTTIGNTIAVFTNSAEHWDVWRSDLVEARDQLRQVGDKNLAAFLDAVIDLLDANGDPEGLGSHLKGTYREAWQALIATLAMRRDMF